MSLYDDIQAQLETELVGFPTIGLSTTTQAIEDFDTQVPAALYYLDSEQSEPSPYANRTTQPGEVAITVILVCPTADLLTRKAELRAAMVGFQPTGDGWDVFEHDTGETLAILGALTWWRETYSAINHSGS